MAYLCDSCTACNCIIVQRLGKQTKCRNYVPERPLGGIVKMSIAEIERQPDTPKVV